MEEERLLIITPPGIEYRATHAAGELVLAPRAALDLIARLAEALLAAAAARAPAGRGGQAPLPDARG